MFYTVHSLTLEGSFHIYLLKGNSFYVLTLNLNYPAHENMNLKLPQCLLDISFLPQVCDTFLKYGLPLMVMPPPGVFYPALLAIDPVSVDRLAYIMYRWGFFISMLQYCILWVFYYYKAWCSTQAILGIT